MIRSIFSRLTYANVMSSVAVFLALGGVSYAATQLPKNSVGSKQIKSGAVTQAKVDKKLLASLKGVNGVNGVNGATGAPGALGAKGDTGAAGAQGPKGDAGTAGGEGAKGDAGTTGAQGPKGDTGAAGADLTAHTPLPKGTTISGAWSAGSAPTGGQMYGPITFSQPLATALASANVVFVPGSASAHCPGAGQAEQGYLCVYQSVTAANTYSAIVDPTGAGGAGKTAAFVVFKSTSSTGAVAAGTWAVTGN